MYAIVATGGKQYRVSPRDVIQVERLSSPAGAVVELPAVLAMGRAAIDGRDENRVPEKGVFPTGY